MHQIKLNKTLFFCSAIVNFTKFRGSRQHVYDNALAEVVRFHVHIHVSFLIITTCEHNIQLIVNLYLIGRLDINILRYNVTLYVYMW